MHFRRVYRVCGENALHSVSFRTVCSVLKCPFRLFRIARMTLCRGRNTYL